MGMVVEIQLATPTPAGFALRIFALLKARSLAIAYIVPTEPTAHCESLKSWRSKRTLQIWFQPACRFAGLGILLLTHLMAHSVGGIEVDIPPIPGFAGTGRGKLVRHGRKMQMVRIMMFRTRSRLQMAGQITYPMSSQSLVMNTKRIIMMLATTVAGGRGERNEH
jgi:hypothetical protein